MRFCHEPTFWNGETVVRKSSGMLIASALMIMWSSSYGETIVVEPEVTEITISGRGCAPGAEVVARTTSLHGSANEFLTFEADTDGRFSRRIKAPFAGEDEGGIIVNCLDPSGNQIEAFEVSLTYECPPGSRSYVCGYKGADGFPTRARPKSAGAARPAPSTALPPAP